MAGNIFDIIPPEVLTGGGFASLTIGGFWLVFTGRLVPGRIYAEMKADRDAWRTAAEAERTRAEVKDHQLDKLLAQGQAIERVMTSLQEIVQQAQGGR